MNTRFLYPFGVSVQLKNFWSRSLACSFCVSVNDCISVLLQAPNPSAAPSVGQSTSGLPVQEFSERTMSLLHPFPLMPSVLFPFPQGARGTKSRTREFRYPHPVLAKTLPYSSKQIHGTNIDIYKKSVFESFLNSLLDTAPRHNSVPCPAPVHRQNCGVR